MRAGYIRGNLNETFPLGTLAATTLVAQLVGGSVGESTWISSVKAIWALENLTEAAGQGPIMVGFAHSDYTAAEVEEYIENDNSWKIGDEIAKEISRRKIRIVGIFRAPGVALGPQVLNEGRPITTKVNWMINTGQTLDLWAYNTGDVALATTSPDVVVQGHVNLWSR